MLFGSALSVIAVLIIKKIEDEQTFHLNLFFTALLLRLLLATAIYTFDLQDFFGPDAKAYDEWGFMLMQYLTGQVPELSSNVREFAEGGTGFYYIVAAIYSITGRNPLCIQFLNAFAGAGTVIVIYLCAQHIFLNKRVARISAILIAIFPTFIVWTSQALKDGLIIFLLSLTILAALKLQAKFSIYCVITILLGLAAIYSLRFYIFFMLSSAVIGGLVLGPNLSLGKLAQRVFIIILIGGSLTYLGILQSASVQIERLGSLEQAQATREGMRYAAESSYGENTDVSTVSGLLAVLPIGLVYLMFSPFPWEISNFRQLVTLPEVIAWWSSIPLLALGLWFAFRHRLRSTMVILIFTFMLTFAYSILQGNVGTAYRHRAQIQIFLFIFVAVGWCVLQEHFENERYLQKVKRQNQDNRFSKIKARG